MSQTLINGTAYEIEKGNTMVNSTQYTIDHGNTLVGGTGYVIEFAQPVSETAEDYYKHLTRQIWVPQYNGYTSFPNTITDPVKQVDFIIASSGSSGVTMNFYSSQEDNDGTSTYIPVKSRYNNSNPWYTTTSNTEQNYFFKRSEFETGSFRRIYTSSGLGGASSFFRPIVLYHDMTNDKWDDYRLDLQHNFSILTGKSNGTTTVSLTGISGLSDYFDQIDLMIWVNPYDYNYYTSGQHVYIYDKMGQDPNSTDLVIRDIYSGNDYMAIMWDNNTDLPNITHDTTTYTIKRSDLDSGIIRLYANGVAQSNWLYSDNKLTVDWHSAVS